MKNLYFILLMFAFVTGCGKANDTPPAAAAHQFGMMGGSCYDYTSSTYTTATNCPGMNSSSTYTMQNGTCISSTGQQVAASFCTSASNGYYNNNGVCYSSTTNQQVAASFCSSASSGYYNNNGVCYSSTTNQQVAASFCSTTSNGYYFNNGVCYSSSTNQQVAANLCGTNSNLPPQMPMPPQMPYGGGGQCFGNYIYNGNGYVEFGFCYGTNCRGYILIEAASGRTVFCQ